MRDQDDTTPLVMASEALESGGAQVTVRILQNASDYDTGKKAEAHRGVAHKEGGETSFKNAMAKCREQQRHTSMTSRKFVAAEGLEETQMMTHVLHRRNGMAI